MSRFRGRTIILLMLVSGVLRADPGEAELVFSSGEQRVALIELFTSEGCSSCPPADHWLSALKSEPGLWQDFVPVAFHVDYWDDIGWKDRFARAAYSERQRQYEFEGAAGFVYTPGFFYGGKEWLDWRRGGIQPVNASSVGDLSLAIKGNQITVRFDALDSKSRKLVVNVVVLGMNLQTPVRAGENKGKMLIHDFVALEAVSVPLDRFASGYKAITPMPEVREPAEDLALVAWVSEVGQQTPIQAVGGLLPGN